MTEDQLISIEDITGIHMRTTDAADEPRLGFDPGDDLFLPISE